MNHWQQIIQTAMIGTDKQSLSAIDWDETLLRTISTITANTNIDTEEQFLQITTVVNQYTRCGVEVATKLDNPLPICEAESQVYCSPTAVSVLKDILIEDNNSLLALWLQHCSAKQQIVVPELLSILLDKVVQKKSLRQYALACFGKRGIWLSQFNKAWQFAATISDEDLWQTGTTEQRKQVLQTLRTTDAAQARDWLQQTWAQENAATKQSLLETFAISLSADDIIFLEAVAAEKSQKVKDIAIGFLKQLPSSTLVLQYVALLQQCITIKKGENHVWVIV